GELSITSTGAVEGTTGYGIYARSDGTNLTIDTKAAVTGGEDAINAYNKGNGALSITTSGAVKGTNGNAIVAANSRYGTDLKIDAKAEVTGGDHGILAINDGTGVTTITTSGAVTGATGITIGVGASGSRANNAAALINSNAPITGTAGFAINLQGDGNDVVTLGPDSVITGSIDFGNGNDGNGGTNANDIDTLNVLAGFNGVIN
ncbi:MAG: hypothetical protein GY814_11025, partial [Gammaproteobacteria bacterium]|nr:hypothetical protein [Gammaproteobacteria bacterium]